LDPESGLYYYGGRYYDPELGRFISPDPFVPEPSDPQSLNRYSYVLNNPVNYIDPTGFFFDKLFKAIGKIFKRIVGYIVGAIITVATGNPFLGGLVGGMVQAAVNKQNILLGGLIGAATGGILGGLSPGAETLQAALLGTAAGVTAADLASRLASQTGSSGEQTFIQLAQAGGGPGIVVSDAYDYRMEFRMHRPLPPGTLSAEDQAIGEPLFWPLDIIAGIGGITKAAIRGAAKAATRTAWPKTAAEMSKFLKVEGKAIPDTLNTPGRNKTVWELGKSKITLEQHPYHPNAPTWHRGPHWHLDTPGSPHQRFLPGDPIPGY
jgi:RHS repeat-associated protein